MRGWLRAWWSWHIDAVYFWNGLSYELYQEIFEDGLSHEIFEPERATIAFDADATACWATAAHDELLYCPDCGWTNPKTVTHGVGMAER